uniref:Uncharacterized protein n=1 Tax=viral metagenome TaxID=1070528 RepID=A0A6M3KJY2_9ZZZZ
MIDLAGKILAHFHPENNGEQITLEFDTDKLPEPPACEINGETILMVWNGKWKYDCEERFIYGVILDDIHVYSDGEEIDFEIENFGKVEKTVLKMYENLYENIK